MCLFGYSHPSGCEVVSDCDFDLHFPGGSDGKESSCNAEDPGLIPGSGRSPGEGSGNPLQYSCLENSILPPWRSLVGYSSWGHKESDPTESGLTQ